MSAWIVSREHVAALARYFADNQEHGPTGLELEPRQLADKLMNANIASVRAAYPHRVDEIEQEEPFTRAEILAAPILTPISAIKQCECLEYQSCETDDYFRSDAYNWLLRIQAVACNQFVRPLPQWAAAPWGI